MIVFEDRDRDLKRKEAAASMAQPAGAGKKKEAAAAMARPAGAGKKKEAVASEPRVPLASLFPLESTAEARPAGARKKRKEATAEKKGKEATAEKKGKEATAEKKVKEAIASESGDGALKKEGDSLFKEGEMLRLREEFWDAELLWKDGLVEGALDRWLESKKTTQAPAVDRKKKVVRVIIPEAYIKYIKENPTLMRELSDEEMAECPEEYRQMYAIQKIINAKNRAYQKAIITQYDTFGFAYDEKEVTDDDEKEVAVVEN